MTDFVEVVEPIADIMQRAGIQFEGRNFENLYSELCAGDAALREELESVVFDYFSTLRLPPEPTIYDHLILSLRPKDVIATFNWDPFLIQAAVRNNAFLGLKLPKLLFLHGSVLSGYCQKDRVHGTQGRVCSKCGTPFTASRLLFPVSSKEYDKDPEIADSWEFVRRTLKDAFMVTIFGYGAPASDLAAVQLMEEAWGGAEERNMEQFEIVDIRPEEDLAETWKRFIHTHHYEVHSDVYESWLLNHPRRSGEAYWNQYYEALFVERNPPPRDIGLTELQNWYVPLLERERLET